MRTLCESRRWPLRERCAAEATHVVENGAGVARILCADHADALDWPVSPYYASVAEYVAQRENERSRAHVCGRDC